MGLAEDTDALMKMLLERAKEIRSGYKFSEDEKMTAMAFINAGETALVAMCWDDNTKYKVAAGVQMLARNQKAKSLTFVTDGRAVKPDDFKEHFNIPKGIDYTTYKSIYHGILREHGGSVKNLPRHLWHDILCVMTNGPDIPLTIQFQSYIEGENDTVKYVDHWMQQYTDKIFKSDLLTDWWS